MIEELKENIEAEVVIIREINEFFDEYVLSSINEKKIYSFCYGKSNSRDYA